MDIRSKHLSSEERGVILAEHNRGSSQRLIGQLLHRPASTICRELARGRQEDGSYCPQAARQDEETADEDTSHAHDTDQPDTDDKPQDTRT